MLLVTCGVALVLTILRMKNPAVRKFFLPAICFAIANGFYCLYYYGVGNYATTEGGVWFQCMSLYFG